MADSNVELAFFQQILLDHSYYCFSEQGHGLFASERIRAVPLQQALESSERCILIPSNISFKPPSDPVEMVDLYGVSIPIWDRFDDSLFAGWRKIPSADCPLFFANDEGTVVPAWNLFGIVTGLLGFVEEHGCELRDEHNRIPREHNSLVQARIDMYPVLNQMFFAVLAATRGISEGVEGLVEPGELIRKPIVVFSHDCDQLRGNDLYTQAARVARAIRPLARARFPELKHLWWLLVNIVRPDRFYFDDALAMIDLERQYGFRSIFYILNGPSGRYRARTKFGVSKRFIERCPPTWEIGCHYNYWLSNEPDGLRAQLELIATAAGHVIRAGRAHYLTYDSGTSPGQVFGKGIQFDESIGYAEFAGFRCGYAGVFRPLNADRSTVLNMWELPLVFTDANTASERPNGLTFEETFSQIEKTGGVISVLFHPGSCNNPEHPELLGRYHEILRYCHSRQARNVVPSHFIKRLKGISRLGLDEQVGTRYTLKYGGQRYESV